MQKLVNKLYSLTIAQKIGIFIVLEIIYIIFFELVTYLTRFLNSSTAMLWIILLILTNIIFTTVSGVLITLLTKKPVEALLKKMQLVTTGNLEIEPEKIKYKGIIGDAINTLDVMICSLRKLISKEQSLLKKEKFLKEIATLTISTTDKKGLLREIILRTGKLFNADRCFFAPYDFYKKEGLPIEDYAVYLASINVKSVAGLRFYGEESTPFKRIAFEQRQVIVINDTSKLEISITAKNLIEEYEVKSYIGAPLFYGDTAIGMIYVQFTQNYKEFTQDEIDLLASIASQSAIALRQTDLFSEINESRNRESLLRKTITTIRSSLDIDETLKVICDEAAKLLEADRAVVIEVPDKTNYQMWVNRREYLKSPFVKSYKTVNFDLRIGNYLGNIVIDQGTTLAHNSISASNAPDYLKRSYKEVGVDSILFVPIQRQEDKWGMLGVASIESRIWTNEEIGILESIADQIYIAIKQAELYSNTKYQADRASAIRKIIEAIGGSLDLTEILNTICRETQELFQVDRVGITSYPEPENYAVWSNISEYKANSGILGLSDLEIPSGVKKYYGEHLMTEGKDLVIENIEDSDTPDCFKNTYKQMGAKSLLGIPIKRGDDKWGIFVMSQVKHYRKWRDDEIKLMHTIADQAYIAIRQSELYSVTKNYGNKENLLRIINNLILTSKNMEEALDNIASEIGNITKVERVCIATYDPVLKSFSDFIGEYRCNEDIPSTKGVTISVPEFNDFLYSVFSDQNRDYLVIENIDKMPMQEAIKILLKSVHIKSTTIFPIKYQNKLIGVISLSNISKYTSIKKEDIDLMLSITQQISIGINLIQTRDKLNKSLGSEAAIRDLFLGARTLDNHNLIFDYLLEHLIQIYQVDRALHLHYDSNDNLYVTNEAVINKEHEPLVNQIILSADKTVELQSKLYGEATVINNINLEIKDPVLKDYLSSKNIEAFITYPISKGLTEHEKIFSSCMICSSQPKRWTSNEIDSFKLAVDTISIIYFEIRQRKEAEDARNTFIAALTHDLKSPIIAEQKALEFLMSKKGVCPNSEYLEDIYHTNEELLRIVNNILTSYHYESGKFILNIQPDYIEPIIQDAVKSLNPLAKDKESNLITNIEPNLPQNMFDRGEITRVVTNLVSNAIKHTQVGTNICISAKRVNNEVQISVQDNGQGISEDEKPKIFQRYPTEKRKIGTGLGLYISKQIIDAHQGKIWFETEKGKGTTFYFTLPVA